MEPFEATHVLADQPVMLVKPAGEPPHFLDNAGSRVHHGRGRRAVRLPARESSLDTALVEVQQVPLRVAAVALNVMFQVREGLSGNVDCFDVTGSHRGGSVVVVNETHPARQWLVEVPETVVLRVVSPSVAS